MFQNDKAISISVKNIYSGYYIMHTFLKISNKGIDTNLEEKKIFLIKSHYLYLTYKLIN